jgi:hypothetical protein
VAHDDCHVAIHHDGLLESILLQAFHHGLYCSIVFAWVIGVGFELPYGHVYDLHCYPFLWFFLIVFPSWVFSTKEKARC